MDAEIKKEIALHIYHAESKQQRVQSLSNQYPEIELDDAYQIQYNKLKYQIEGGKRIVGKKIGLTSGAIQSTFGIEEPVFGQLLDDMEIPTGEMCQIDALIEPCVEGELAFILKKPLIGPDVTVTDVYEATAYVVPCFEICDSRFRKSNVTITDLVADNVSASKYLLGTSGKRVEDIDFQNIKMTIERNGQRCGAARGSAVMGNPAIAVAWLANKLYQYGDGLAADDVVLSGAFMKAFTAKAGDTFSISVDDFPMMKLHFK